MSAPTRDQIKKGLDVSIETKENQGTGKLTHGTVKDILTSGQAHPHGIKVRLEDGSVGRVKQIGKNENIQDKITFTDLEKKEIPKTEDQHNEFKEFYQYDRKIPDLDKPAIEGLKRSVQERLATAVCSFGNSYEGGFVYLGVKSDGTIAGLEEDMKLGGFTDYGDSFANHMLDKLEDLLKDRVFLTSKIRLKFRDMDEKTICIIQVLPADQPVYIHGKTKSFLSGGQLPRQ